LARLNSVKDPLCCQTAKKQQQRCL